MMMRKKTKMAWSVALSAAMAAGLLAGCGSNGGSESKSGSTATSSAKTESSAGDTADTSDRPTYKIATVRWTDTWPTDFLHEGVMKEIEDKMNINMMFHLKLTKVKQKRFYLNKKINFLNRSKQ